MQQRPWEESRNTVNKFRIAVAMKTSIEDRKACNVAADVKKLMAVKMNRRADKAKGF